MMKPVIKNIYGDKKNPEPEHHEFLFRGGNVNVQRTSNNEYWVHIEVVRPENVMVDAHSLSKAGRITEGRMDFAREEAGVKRIPDVEHTHHIAVRIAAGE